MNFWDLVLIWFAPIAIGVGLAYFLSRNRNHRIPKKESEPPELLSMIAHQFRSPLTSIKWISERLATTKLDVDQRDKVLEIQKVNQHLIDLIDNLKKIGREKLNGEAEGREYFLANLVNEITGLFKFPAERKNIRIALGVHPGVGKIKTDKFLLTEAMKNILENAIDYSPADSAIDVSVNLDGGLAGRGRRYLISITNEGEAISEEDQKRIFDKFFRGSVGVSARRDGSGLGLFIAKTAIQANHGEILLKSPIKNNRGASFTISLPAN